MRFLAALSAVVAVVAAQVESQPLGHEADSDAPRYLPEIEVLEANTSYGVKLECAGCPFAVKDANQKVVWQKQENALYLRFSVDTLFAQKALLMNMRSILPLEPVPPYFSTQQLPANITIDKMSSVGYASTPWGVRVPLQYEHTVLRTQEHGQIWVQMDITGLALQMINDPRFPGLVAEPVKLDNEEQKLVQILVQQHKETNELFIEDVQVVRRADRVQPYRMKCGRLAMVQTSYDPSEWDEYGKYGTWARLQKLVFDKAGDFWSEYVEDNALVFPFAMLLAFGVVMLRRLYQSRQQGMIAKADDAEIALLSSYEDAPPAYADIPIIKIEEYD